MSLNLLSNAALHGRTLQDLQDQMTTMRGEIAALRGASQSSSSAATAITPAHDGSQPGTSGYLSSSRISDTSWAEEMDIIQPLDNDDAPDADVSCSEGARVVEVSEATQKLLKRSFESMKNSRRLQTRNDFSLPKVAITKTPSLDQVMASQCSKSTKSNDWSLSRIQALMLDAVAPLTEVMELFHSEADEVSSEQIAKAVEPPLLCWAMPLARCQPCGGLMCSRSTTGTWWSGPRTGRRSSMKRLQHCLGRASPKMCPSIWTRWLL